MELLFNILIALTAFVSMEGVAWLAHKYIMHGLLWKLHKDHHQPGANQVLEKNDLFFLIFAIPAIVCFLLGYNNFSPAFWVGSGITFYGLIYFLVHEIFIHQRIKLFRNSNLRYFKAIRKAHKMHHKHLNKEDGECFGMLWVPKKYFKQASKTN